jgi:hypothetical protein
VSGAGARDTPDPDDLAGLVGARLTKYVDLWESASATLSSGTYHADDLVDDWFRLAGPESHGTRRRPRSS